MQYSHSRHAQPSQGIATRSPSATRVTPRPTRWTMPTPSWPGTNGGVGLTGQSPFAACMSVWHRPEASIFTRIWPSLGSGIGRSSITSGSLNSLTTAAFIAVLPPEITWISQSDRRPGHRRRDIGPPIAGTYGSFTSAPPQRPVRVGKTVSARSSQSRRQVGAGHVRTGPGPPVAGPFAPGPGRPEYRLLDVGSGQARLAARAAASLGDQPGAWAGLIGEHQDQQ